MINVEVLRKSAYGSKAIKHYEEQIDEKLEEAASRGFSRIKINCICLFSYRCFIIFKTRKKNTH